jgi:hypothetical protein
MSLAPAGPRRRDAGARRNVGVEPIGDDRPWSTRSRLWEVSGLEDRNFAEGFKGMTPLTFVLGAFTVEGGDTIPLPKASVALSRLEEARNLWLHGHGGPCAVVARTMAEAYF